MAVVLNHSKVACSLVVWGKLNTQLTTHLCVVYGEYHDGIYVNGNFHYLNG